jgi:hypothetical protein
MHNCRPTYLNIVQLENVVQSNNLSPKRILGSKVFILELCTFLLKSLISD